LGSRLTRWFCDKLLTLRCVVDSLDTSRSESKLAPINVEFEEELMSHSSTSTKDEAPINFLFENSIFLIVGALSALVWANTSPETHHNFFHFPLSRMFTESADGHADGHADGPSAEDEHNQTSGTKDLDSGENKSQSTKSTENHSFGLTPSDSLNRAATKTAADSQRVDPNQTDESQQYLRTTTPVTATASPENASHEAIDDATEDASAKTDKNNQAATNSEGDHEDHGHPITLHFIINDIMMAIFFAIATKEVWEAMLPGGSLSNPRKAALPLLATVGGVVGPVVIYLGGVLALGKWGELSGGWAIPCATDIAFSYLIARLIFGGSHPAIAFLLLLAIADDAIGLMIIAVFYPQGELQLLWMLLALVAMVLTFTMRKCKIHSFWWYLLIPGIMCWFAFYKAGIHAALGLVPIIPFMPHAHTDLGMFAKEELHRDDTLNEFEHWWKPPVEIFLGLFGLCNAAVPLEGIAAGTWLVLAGLMIGKPVGITLCTYLGEKVFKLSLPEGMDYRQVITVGCVASIGFTVALFVSDAAFSKAPREILDSVKMGALLSFGGAILSFVVAKALGVKVWNPRNPH